MSPCTWAIGDKEPKETPDEKAFNDFFSWYTFHKPAFGKIEKEKTNCSTHQNGGNGGFKSWRLNDSSNPVSLRFYVQLFKLHICKYVNKKICKSNLFSLQDHFIRTFL